MPIGSRRRRYDHEDDRGEEDLVDDRKRRRKDVSEIEERLENLIIRVGEKSSSSLESNLEGLAGVLEADLTTYKARILQILLKCVVEMPEKMTIYSTLVGLLNAKNYNFGGEFVELLLKQLRDRLKSGDLDSSLFIILFLSDLVNCKVVSPHSCLGFLENLTDVILEENIPQARSDWYIFSVVHTFPWVAKELSDKKQMEFQKLIATVEKYLAKRRKLHVPMLRVWGSSRPHPQEEYLDCLWAQTGKLSMESWQERHIVRHYVAFDAVLCEALQHNLPSFIPPSHQENADYPLPRVVFRMFDYTDCPDDGPVLPGAHSIERFLVEQELSWIIGQHYTERKDCAAALLSYDKRTKIPLNYMILEVIFGQMFLLPKSPYVGLFYGALLIELCKLQPNSMPQVLAQAAELLYQRVDTMQPACFDRLVDWFSYHLSNFQFRWSWDDWTDCLELDLLSPKQLFVREVLAKCMRFSYHQRVVDIVPSSFAPLTPPKPEPVFKYSQEGAQSLPGTSIAHQLAQAIRNKCTAEDVLNLLKDCPSPEDGDLMETSAKSYNPLQIDVFVLTLLHLGSKSFSHSFAALAKYHSALKKLTEDNESAQLCVLKAVAELWANHPQMVVVLVDKLLKMQIVECGVVTLWVFSEELKTSFLRMCVWEIMQSALVKLSRHVERLRLDLDKAKENMEDLKEADRGSDDEDQFEQKLETSRSAIQEMNEKLEGAESVQKNLLLTVFQKFTILLTEHLLQSEAEGQDFNTHWYRWVIGRFRQMFLAQHMEASKYMDTLESYLFTSDIDPHILEIFHQFCALHR